MTTLSYGIDYLLRHSPNASVPIINTATMLSSTNILDQDRYTPFIAHDYTNPFKIVTGYYPDLDKDPQVHRTLKKYYYYKLLDKWMYSDLKSLLAFVVLDNGKAKLINSISDYNPNSVNNSKEDELTLRINLLENLISTDLIKSVLERIVHKYGIHWYHLNKNEDIIKKKLEIAIKELLENKIKKNK
jgi:hypothetical protein